MRNVLEGGSGFIFDVFLLGFAWQTGGISDRDRLGSHGRNGTEMNGVFGVLVVEVAGSWSREVDSSDRQVDSSRSTR